MTFEFVKMVSNGGKRFSLIVFILCVSFTFYTLFQLQQIQLRPRIFQTREQSNETDLSQVCKIPQLKPFHKLIQRFIKPPKIPKCKEKFPPFFNSTLRSELIPAISLENFYSKNIKSCCYRLVIWKSDYKYSLSNFCYPISLELKTKIKSSHEFIAIYCGKEDMTMPPRLNFVGAHAFVHLKPEVEKKLNNPQPPSVDRPNVVILAIDSVSKANFLRWMPKSHKFLMEEMEAIEMKGYNKMRDYTYPHLVALTTSLTTSKFQDKCVKKSRYYNQQNCPFIWKDFANKGYLTAFAEDVYKGNTFNNDYIRKNIGFRTPPADYYPRAFSQISDEHYRKTGSLYAYMCHGPRLLFETLLDYIKKFIWKMNNENKSFFSLFWETALTHDEMNNAMIADEPLKEALSWMHENKQLENTVFILMSDHGQVYGRMRATPQGQLEYMLPFVYFVLPKSFKDNYSRAYENLRGNERRLITALDLHYTIKDLANLELLQEGPLQQREEELGNLSMAPPEGISLFLPIPANRTCSQARIEEKSCSCSHYATVSVKEKSVLKAAKQVVKLINKRISKESKCATVSLYEVEMAQRLSNSIYRINFNTKPANASYEAVVMNYGFAVRVSKVIRTNSYGNQSVCVSNRKLKEYCYCQN